MNNIDLLKKVEILIFSEDFDGLRHLSTLEPLKLGKLAPFPPDKVLEQGLQQDSSARTFLPKDKLCDLD